MFACCTRLKLIDRDVRACRVLPKCLCHRIQALRKQTHVWFPKPTDFHLTGKRKQRVHIGLSSFHRERSILRNRATRPIGALLNFADGYAARAFISGSFFSELFSKCRLAVHSAPQKPIRSLRGSSGRRMPHLGRSNPSWKGFPPLVFLRPKRHHFMHAKKLECHS